MSLRTALSFIGAKIGDAMLRRRAVTFTPRGYRDVVWCPYLNEPAILQFKNGKPDCPNCNGNYEPGSHMFICNVRKPY